VLPISYNLSLAREYMSRLIICEWYAGDGKHVEYQRGKGLKGADARSHVCFEMEPSGVINNRFYMTICGENYWNSSQSRFSHTQGANTVSDYLEVCDSCGNVLRLVLCITPRAIFMSLETISSNFLSPRSFIRTMFERQ
jgi:hypothetical protein